MIHRLVKVENTLGLHARAAAKLVRLASRFQSSIRLAPEAGHPQADCRGILGVLMLSARQGTKLTLSIDGPDEEEALGAILGLFREKFGESH